MILAFVALVIVEVTLYGGCGAPGGEKANEVISLESYPSPIALTAET